MIGMPENRNFYSNLMQFINAQKTTPGQPNFAILMQYAEKNDLLQILEFLYISREMQTQVKLFSVLAAYMVSNGENSDIIIKFNPLYDKIFEVLSRGLPQKIYVTLNFVTSLLYTDIEDASTKRRTLVAYAQNMLRTSGCLDAMTNLFTNSMIQQDTWQTLCQCLAETCYRMEKNQNYCSHLVPLCIRRCEAGNEYVLQLLQSLLQNNDHNIKLFIESGGLAIFTREFLKFDHCLQLLSTVVSRTECRTKLLRDTNVIYDLNDLKQLYGTSSEVGQWATVILYTMHSNGPDILKETTKVIINDDSNIVTCGKGHNQKPIGPTRGNDTSELFNNVIREVLTFEAPRKKALSPKFNLQNISIINEKAKYANCNQEKHTSKNNYKYLKNKSISRNNELKQHFANFANPNDLLLRSEMFNYTVVNSNNFSSIKCNLSTNKYSKQKPIERNRDISSNCYQTTITNETHVQTDTTINFRPAFVSTPKRHNKRNITNKNNSHISKIHLPINKKIIKRINSRIDNETQQKLRNIDSKNNDKSVRNRTIGARLFDAINESCTTIVKTFKNVFKSTRNQTKDLNKTKTEFTYENTHCEYSFTDYMRKRDEFLNEDKNFNSTGQCLNECFTCNDTICLKQKIINDDVLKENVKRLKLGINLYGCDFKKISKTLWPRESYMSPSVLYNLYRKLIAK